MEQEELLAVRRSFPVTILMLALLGAACTNIYTPTPSVSTATLPPLATFTPRYTATPIPTVSPRPTFTYTPSPTPIPPTPSDTPTATPTQPMIGRVSTVQDAVNMRAGPGVNFQAIVGVAKNTDLIILAANEDQSWYNVRLQDGTEGWIAANLLFIVPSPTPEPTNTEPGVVVEISGTPLATALLGGLPVTATPSFTPTIQQGTPPPIVPPTLRTPGVVTATATATATTSPREGIPTITPGALMTSAFGAVSQVTQTPSTDRTPTPTGQAAGAAPRYGVDVLAYCELFNEVPPPLPAGSTIDVFWGWLAQTREYLQQHIANVEYEVRLDGRLLDNWRQYADRIRQREDGTWAIYWYVPVSEPLTPGSHTITYRVTWRNPIFDGTKAYGPGTDTESEAFSCTFEVR